MTIDSKRLRELLAAASPGPWEAEPLEGGRCNGIFARSDFPELGPFGGNEIVTTDSGVYGPKWADAQLIVEAVNALPELLEVYEGALRDGKGCGE